MRTKLLKVERLITMEQLPGSPGFDAGTYGQSFADIYDAWYPADHSTQAAVEYLSLLASEVLSESVSAESVLAGAGPSPRILELGVGTGRLALPLELAGNQIHGMDSSAAMLEQLQKKPGAANIKLVLGDVADPAAWPEGPFELVVAAFNLLFNLSQEAAQAALFRSAAQALGPNGRFVVEAFIPAPLDANERRLAVREVTAASVVLIATDATAATGEVIGQHIELIDGEPVRLRPWKIRVATPTQIDALAAAAGLELQHRHADWIGTEFDPHGTAHVSVYRKALSQA
jgi:SAM-dependent methyltransferase